MSKLNAFVEGMRAYHAGDYEQAIGLFGKVMQRRGLPARMGRYYCGMAHRALGIELVSTRQYADAREHLRQAVRLIGHRADLAEYMLTVYAGLGDFDRCASQGQVLSAAHPDEAFPRISTAQAQWRAGRREEAVMTLTHALRELGDDASLHINLGLFYSNQDKLDAACHHFQEASQCDCSSVAAYRCLGLVESARGEFEAAVRAFQRALALDPNDLMLMYQLFLAADATSATGGAVVLAIPEPVRCDSPSQINRLAEYVVSEPDFVQAFLDMPASDADEELFGVLLSVLHAALAAHGNYADLHYFLATTLSRMDRPEAARGHLLHAIEINPTYRKALTALAELEADRGAVAQAVSYLQRAIACGADYPDVHARMGELLVRLGMTSLAREHFTRALRINSGFDRAAQGLAASAA